jgi:hypothetical protein
MSYLSLTSVIPQKYITLGYSVDKDQCLNVILFQMPQQVFSLPLYTKYDTLGIPAKISGTHEFKEMTTVQDCSFHELQSRNKL